MSHVRQENEGDGMVDIDENNDEYDLNEENDVQNCHLLGEASTKFFAILVRACKIISKIK